MADDRPLIVALDFPDAESAWSLVKRLDPGRCRLKVGFELFVAEGPKLVEQLVRADFEVFLDLKFHDIPNTVKSAVTAAGRLGVWMVNVHASGGRAMLEAARQAASLEQSSPKVVAVTVLTSMGRSELAQTGVAVSPEQQVMNLAKLAREAGLDGVVCSAREASALRQEMGSQFELVTPGIRPSSAACQDQKRVMTPADAMLAGANYLVVGRPITRAEDPQAAADAILAEIASV